MSARVLQRRHRGRVKPVLFQPGQRQPVRVAKGDYLGKLDADAVVHAVHRLGNKQTVDFLSASFVEQFGERLREAGRPGRLNRLQFIDGQQLRSVERPRDAKHVPAKKGKSVGPVRQFSASHQARRVKAGRPARGDGRVKARHVHAHGPAHFAGNLPFWIETKNPARPRFFEHGKEIGRFAGSRLAGDQLPIRPVIEVHSPAKKASLIARARPPSRSRPAQRDGQLCLCRH